MSEKEMVYSLLETLPSYKMGYVLAYLQGLTAESPNEVTKAALREAEAFKTDPGSYKRYSSFAEAVADIEAGE